MAGHRRGCGLVHKVVVPAGVTVVVPPIRGLRQDPGHPLTLVIEMLRGQHVSDYTVKGQQLFDPTAHAARPRPRARRRWPALRVAGRVGGLDARSSDTCPAWPAVAPAGTP